MSFTTPWGLLALLAVPAVLALHKLRRRLVERRVAGLFLFAPDALSADAGRKVSPLLRTASLALELAAAALFALLLGGLRFGGERRTIHLVAVLDDTASLGAVVDGSSAVDRGRRIVKARLAALPSDALATIVVTGRSPTLLAGPRVPAGIAAAALDGWVPRRPAHDPALAFDLGLELAGPDDPLLFVTDRGGADAPPRYEVESVGAARGNAALSNVRRIPVGSEETVFVDVISHGPPPPETEVVVAVGEGPAAKEVARKSVRLEAGRTARLSVRLPRSDLPVRVTLSPDALAIDGEALLLADPPRVVPFSVEWPPEVATALGLDRLAKVLPAVVRVEPSASPALRFHADPARAPAGTTDVVLSAPGTERDPWIGPFLLERRHPLLEGIVLEGVVWSAGRGALPGRGLVFAGDQALLAEDRRDDGVVLTLDLDPARSNLAASPDWPILLFNVVERVRATLPGPVARNLRMDEPIEFRETASVAGRALRLVAPSGREEAARGRGLLAFEPREPGVHRLLAGDAEVGRWSVQFVDARASDLTSCVTSSRAAVLDAKGPGGRAVTRAAAGAAGLEGRALAVLLLLLVVADVFVLSRGRRAEAAA